MLHFTICVKFYAVGSIVWSSDSQNVARIHTFLINLLRPHERKRLKSNDEKFVNPFLNTLNISQLAIHSAALRVISKFPDRFNNLTTIGLQREHSLNLTNESKSTWMFSLCFSQVIFA